MRRVPAVCLAVGVWAGAAVYAQEPVTVRLGQHDGYARIVFDWPQSVTYQTSRSTDGTLSIGFQKAAALSLPDVAGNKFIRSLTQTSAAGQPVTVVVAVTPGSDTRHFTVGSRVIVDVFGQSAAKSEPAPQKKSQTVAQPTSSPITSPQKTPNIPPVAAAPVAPVEKESAAGPTIIEKAMPAVDAHVVTVSVTESVGMAAFERNGTLWIVMDRADLVAPPELSGPREEFFPPLQRHEIKGGVAYSLDLPPGSGPELYSEGGGLVWRLLITPHRREQTPAALDRSFRSGDHIRGGTLTAALRGVGKILDVPDPSVGDTIKAVTVGSASEYTGVSHDFVDFRILRSLTGMAVVPRVDDLSLTSGPAGVQISRPGGLALSRDRDVKRSQMRRQVSLDAPKPADLAAPSAETSTSSGLVKIYDFDRWMMGGLDALDQNQRILMAGISAKDKTGRVQDLLTLAKMNVANDRGQEAIGFLSLAEQEIPALAEGAEFLALRGAAEVLTGKFELGLADLSAPVLQEYTELNYWRAFALASLEDWQQARAIMPADFSILVGYPKMLLEKIGLKLAEVALRAGDVAKAESVLAALNRDRETLKPWTIAGIDYFKGEAHRQSGENERAMALWRPLSTGGDDWYRARAGLALTMLETQTGAATPEQAVDRLEGLRYAWRGDELEAQINFMLGKLYLEQRKFLKGFGILREAASMSPEADISQEITDYMGDQFRRLLMEDKELSPLDAVTIYEEFRELTPPDAEGNRLVQSLAEKLVEADLLDRASAILQHQVSYRVQGAEKARVAVRLAAIYLLNGVPDKALASLKEARDLYGAESDSALKKEALRKVELMHARALSDMNKTEEALVHLSKFDPAPDVNRLRADIAWQAGLWEDAAEALQDLILDQAIDPARPLTEKQADLILNRAVALNLSGNRVALANMRQRYEDAMKKTARARLFDVVTRPRQSTVLADRQTLESLVSEVDIFKDFLETYRADTGSQ